VCVRVCVCACVCARVCGRGGTPPRVRASVCESDPDGREQQRTQGQTEEKSATGQLLQSSRLRIPRHHVRHHVLFERENHLGTSLLPHSQYVSLDCGNVFCRCGFSCDCLRCGEFRCQVRFAGVILCDYMGMFALQILSKSCMHIYFVLSDCKSLPEALKRMATTQPHPFVRKMRAYHRCMREQATVTKNCQSR
jgi:hypothetical protein